MLLTTTQQDFDRRLQQNTADRLSAGKIVTERIKNQGEMGVGYKTGQVPSGGYGPGHMPSRIMPLEMPDTEHGRAMAQDSMGRGVSPDRFRYTANEMNKEEISGWKQDWKAQNDALDQRRQAQAAEQKAADDRWNTKFGDIPSVNKMAIEGAKTTADENRARMQQFYGDRAMTQQYGGMTRSTNALQSSARTLGIDEASRRARAGTMRLENEAAMARIPLEQTRLQTNAQMYGHDATLAGTQEQVRGQMYGHDQTLAGTQEQARAQMYGHDQTLVGTRDTNAATRYGADQTLAGQREKALAPKWGPDSSSVYDPRQGMIENPHAKTQEPGRAFEPSQGPTVYDEDSDRIGTYDPKTGAYQWSDRQKYLVEFGREGFKDPPATMPRYQNPFKQGAGGAQGGQSVVQPQEVKRVRVQGKDGKTYTVPEDQVEGAKAQGYTVL